MKAKRFIFFIVSLLSLTLFLGIRVSAQEKARSYIVKETENFYSLYLLGADAPEKLLDAERLAEIFDELPSGASVAFEAVSSSETLQIPYGEYSFTGSITLLGGAITVPEGSSLTLSDMSIDIPESSAGFIRVKGGELTVGGGAVISSFGGTPITVDFSSSSLLNLNGADISTLFSPCIYATHGRVNIKSSELDTATGVAIKNSATLALGSGSKISGSGIDVETAAPIRMSLYGEHYIGELDIKYLDCFADGSMTEVLYNTCSESSALVKIYDKGETLYRHTYFEQSEFSDEKSFSAVYLPYKVSYYDKNEKISERDILSGMLAEPYEYSPQSGYCFSGWYTDEALSLPYDFSHPVNSDTAIYIKKRLIAPTFSLSSLNFIYDKSVHTLGFGELSHPLDAEGIYSYEWFCDDVLVSSANELGIIRVSQSGSYFCKLKFSYNGDFVEITTPCVSVNVEKCAVDLPVIDSKAYTGYMQYPDIAASQYYTADIVGGTSVGSYPVRLTLSDCENYKWSESDAEYADVSFEIVRAENFWQREPTVADSFVGVAPQINCTAAFGSAVYLFSDEIYGEYTSAIPTLAGEYYLMCEVAATDNYSGLRSEPIPFTVVAEIAEGMYIEKMPDKLEYTAFEDFLATGISVVVDYNSGRREYIGAESLSIAYMRADSLRFGDSSVLISYSGLSLLVPVSVKRAEYDISDIKLYERDLTYDGGYKALSYSGNLPVGKDGIPLCASVVGGGIGVGEYTVSLVFSTESENYKTPSALSARLRILPMPVKVITDTDEFVYTGQPLAPYAYFLNENRIKIPISVIGAKIKAGDGYIATLSSPSANYVLDITELPFSIKKADYDMSKLGLQSSVFVYDGAEKRVTLTGLPSGVRVIGYADNYATDAGEYMLRATLSYDTENYNEPKLPTFEWKIEPAEYDMSGVVFADKAAVYNGSCHYPDMFGSMPIGADGIPLRFSYSYGVTEVTDEPISVDIIFYTESRNYKIPDSIRKEVQVTPMPISAVWGNTVLIYNENEQMPTASSEYTAITVFGSGINAGRYVATAHSNSRNYTIINSECEYVIKKAENFWLTPLCIPNIYESGELTYTAESAGGEVTLKFFADEGLKNEIAKPTASGIYYAVAYSSEGENHLSCVGEAVRFEIFRVLPCGIKAVLSDRSFFAFESLGVSDFSLTLIYNDGAEMLLDSSVANVIYENGDSLRHRDECVTISYLDFESVCEISVALATYDMSGVLWENANVVYNGREQKISVSGLPEGVSVREYVGGIGTEVGIYPVSVYLNYDSENYHAPDTLVADLIIEKCVIPTPSFPGVVYDGNFHLPTPPENTYIKEATEVKNAGAYEFILRLSDSKNYAFENNADELTVSFEIRKAELILEVESITLHLFEKLGTPKYTAAGALYGDEVEFEFSEIDGKLCAVSKNPNYSVKIIGGEIEKLSYPSSDYLGNIFICILLFAIFALFAYIVTIRRTEICEFISNAYARVRYMRAATRYMTDGTEERLLKKEPVYLLPDSGGEYSTIMSVDMPKADSLISDNMAKNLIKRSYDSIVTSGHKRVIVNIGAISSAFSRDEHVDINKMKEKGLIPRDAGSVKVLADGIIDKPLFVYANAFSLSAVKMIALTGGEAVKVTTAKRRRHFKDDLNIIV